MLLMASKPASAITSAVVDVVTPTSTITAPPHPPASTPTINVDGLTNCDGVGSCEYSDASLSTSNADRVVL